MTKIFSNATALVTALAAFAIINVAILLLALLFGDWGDKLVVMGAVQTLSLFVSAGVAAVLHARLSGLPLVGVAKFKLIGGVLLVAVVESTAIYVIMANADVVDALFVNTFWFVAVGGFIALGAVRAAASLTRTLAEKQ
jgi:hypothetical protein